MRKIVVPLLVGTLLCMFLTSCSSIPKPPTETQIAETLPDDITTIVIENPFDYTNADVYKMNIEEVSIEKRQTNEKNDVVCCIVELANEYYHFIKHMKLEYNYYDQGGWCLDKYDEYETSEWEILDVPFGVEEASVALYNYEISGPGIMTSDLSDNVIWFSFPIEEVHANGTYEGTGLVTCQFDGKRWQSETNTDNIHFVWDIQGTWAYSKIEETSYDKTINEIEVTITDFDQTTGSMSGSWYMHSYFSLFRKHYETTIPLYNNPERVKVNIATDRALVELWERPNDAGMHSFVRFHPDYVEADYSTLSGNQFGPVYLERQLMLDTSSSGNGSSTLNDDEKIWNNLIYEYFNIMETSNQEQIMNYMLESGPYGDDISVIGEHLKNYEISKIEHSNEFYASIHDELEDEIEQVKLIFAEYKPDLNIVMIDCAAVYVQAEFESQDLGTVDYKFWFINNSGTWEIFYVDDVF